MKQSSTSEVLSEKIVERVKQKKIYFAHMSVGHNILNGISDIAEKINIQELDEQFQFNIPVFSHSKIGENTKPLLKIDDFSKKLTEDIGENIDIAFLKLCYVDINSASEIDLLFNHYFDTYNKLHKKFPKITFIHFTVPLTTQQKGIKAIIKKILGREVRGYTDNLNRQKFNELIRKNYIHVFDLAEIESTRPDGTRTVHTINGKIYYSLFPGYTEDGGHLNKKAGEIVAEKLLTFISKID